MRLLRIRMKRAITYLLGISALMLNSCQNQTIKQEVENIQARDVHSYSEPQLAVVKHLDLSLIVDFDKKVLSGFAKYRISASEDATEIIFDTYDLNISRVTSGEEELDFSLGQKDDILGSALSVGLPQQSDEVTIYYETSPSARALQWLSPEQTAQKEFPFLFTQSQAILARTWIPCQDSPGIRFTYDAQITVPKGFMALMSAENPQELDEDGTYDFNMPQPIPSYLMALTVGDVAFKALGERTGVYAEPVMLEKCHSEFSEMEDMLLAAEALYGPYAWGRYDVIVLPPSFPFGGMENPRLTFATPTIIAGDKSLTSLVAHELAHSWSGNLVTNATWDDFWLNEGFTVYFEQRIMEAVYGRDYSEMLAYLSFHGLQDEMAEMMAKDPQDTKLKLDLKGRDPDDGMNAIAYDKGYLLLRKLEETMGREKFDIFLKNYFRDNAFLVMDTEHFLSLLNAQMTEEEKQLVRVNDWVYKEGLPDNHPIIESQKFILVDTELNKWLNGGMLDDVKKDNWSTHEWLHFINSLPDDLSQNQVAELDKAFGFTNSGNCEILAAWFQVTIRTEYHPADQAMEDFLVHVGRRKFLTPTYKAMIEKDASKEMARQIYKKARGNYHSVSTATMDELLDWKS